MLLYYLKTPKSDDIILSDINISHHMQLEETGKEVNPSHISVIDNQINLFYNYEIFSCILVIMR